MKSSRITSVLLAATLACGCANQPSATTTVVVVPTASGHVGAVVVNPGPGQIVVDKAYESVSQGPHGDLSSAPMTVADVDRIFHEAREAKPTVTYVVHFGMGDVALTPDTQQTLSRLVAKLPELHPADIVVTGHTDRFGYDERNLDLSELRAERVRDYLVSHGVARELVRTYWQGDRQPVVANGAGGVEPRNRRVEIEVRRQ